MSEFKCNKKQQQQQNERRERQKKNSIDLVRAAL